MISNVWFRRLVILACLFLPKASELTAQSASRLSPEAFVAAPDTEKQKLLQAVQRGQLQIDSQEIDEIMAAALGSPNATVRVAACDFITFHVSVGQGAMAGAEAASRAAPYIAHSQPMETLFKEDPEPRVRRAALIALGNVIAATQGRTPGTRGFMQQEIEMPAAFGESLASQYSREPAADVRGEIVKTLALMDVRTPLRRTVILDALSDPSASVLSFALRGVANMRIEEAAPRVVTLLRHEDRAVRIVAAQALTATPKAAALFVTALREAAAVEADTPTRLTMEAAIQVIEGRK